MWTSDLSDSDGKILPVADVNSVSPFVHATVYATMTSHNTEKVTYSPLLLMTKTTMADSSGMKTDTFHNTVMTPVTLPA